MKTSGIYKIESKVRPERFYIGSAIDIKDRWRCHLKDLKYNKHGSIILQRHYDKYGADDLVFSVIEPCLPQFLIIREQYYIDILNPFFNCCKIAGSCLGIKRSMETIIKLRNSHKGKSKTEKHKRNIGNALIDKTIHKFYNEKYGLLECTQHTLKRKFNIHSSNLSRLCKGKSKILKGWKLIA